MKLVRPMPSNIPVIVLALLAATPASASAQEVVQPLPGTTDADALADDMRRLATNPRDVNALVDAARLSLRLEDVRAAAALLQRAENVDPRNPRVRAAQGSVLVQSERPGQALRYFAEAEARGLDARTYAADRGLAYDLTGQQERAQRDYARALRDEPNDAETIRRYALSLGISGQRQQALALLDPLVRKNDRAAWRAQAFVLAMTGDVPGASRIAATMIPGGAVGLAAFFARLPSLPATDRAFAVHFGQVRVTPERLADARLAPPLGGASRGNEVALASVTPVPRTVPVPVATAIAPRAPSSPAVAPVPATDAILAAAREPAAGTRVTAAPPMPLPRATTTMPPVRIARPTTAVPAIQPTAPLQPGMTSVVSVPPRAPAPSAAVVPPAAVAPSGPAVVAPAPVVFPATSAPVQVAAAPVPATDATSVATAPVPAAVAPHPVQVAALPSAPAAARRPLPTGTRASEDSILARIIANLSIPAAELGVPAPARPTPAPLQVAAAPVRPATPGRAVPTTVAPDPLRVAADRVAADRLAAEKVAADRLAAAKAAADRKAADRKAIADRKALADKKAAAEKKAIADREAADRRKLERANPARIWVQVAGGAYEGDLAKAYAAVRAKAPAVFGSRGGWTTPLRATNRVLTGPFKSDGEARAFVNDLKKEGVPAFTFGSDAGQPVKRLGAK